MNRTIVLGVAATLLAACGSGEATGPASETPAAAAPDATMLPTPQQNAVAATGVTCDGQPYKVAFNDFNAVVTYDDGAAQELPLQPAAADSEPELMVYTDGKISFARSVGVGSDVGKPETIRFARGTLAWQDCTLASD